MSRRRFVEFPFSMCLVLSCSWMLLAGSLAPGKLQAEELPVLEQALLDKAPEILKFAHEQGDQNIGVLKFRIREGSDQPTDRAGLLNRNLAERLELALIIKNKPLDPIGIVHNASQVAATLPGANHLTAEGRQKLFTGQYPLAWGNAAVVPDAFLVGVVQVDPDFQKATVGISAFDQKNAKLRDVTKFSGRLTTNEVVELGGSFTTRGLFDGGQLALGPVEREKAAANEASKQAALIKTKAAKHPLDDPSSPVVLTILYDGQPVAIEFRDGGAFAPEPAEGQKVSFRFGRRDPEDKTRYAVVLRVNGENTLYRQRKKDLDCNKWILEPGEQPLTIQGFQLNDNEVQQFKVLSKAASKSREIDYRADTGTISMSAFRPLDTRTPPPPSPSLLSEAAEDFSILSRGVFPPEPPANLASLKQQLALASRTRGLISEGQTVPDATRTVKFEADPVPAMVATVTYYKP
jgi:hypothetical protein